jgi:hypothetical protein
MKNPYIPMVLVIFAIFALVALAQLRQTSGATAGGVVFVTAAPSGSCTNPTDPLEYVIKGADAGKLYGCASGTWTQVT